MKSLPRTDLFLKEQSLFSVTLENINTQAKLFSWTLMARAPSYLNIYARLFSRFTGGRRGIPGVTRKGSRLLRRDELTW